MQQVMLNSIFALVGAILIYFSTNISFSLPSTDIQQSAQTFTVLVIAALLSKHYGVLAVVIYLLAGTVGLPVFSDGGSGLKHLFGATGGYLAGFLVAAYLISYSKNKTYFKKVPYLILTMCLAHIIILLLGYLQLSQKIGYDAAFSKGVQPFIIGGAVKSFAAVAVILFAGKIKKFYSKS